MSDSETTHKPRSRGSFASRLLTKELDLRKKPTQEIKISPSGAAQYAVPDAPAEKKEPATIK